MAEKAAPPNLRRLMRVDAKGASKIGADGVTDAIFYFLKQIGSKI
jgi:hypothetical protein